MSPDSLSRDNVLVVSFGDNPAKDTNAYQALTDLEQLDSQGQIKIADAAVVTRDPDGHIEVKSEVGNDPYLGTASGGLIGLLLGIIGGPLGVLLGGTSVRWSDRCSTSTTPRRPTRCSARSRSRPSRRGPWCWPRSTSRAPR